MKRMATIPGSIVLASLLYVTAGVLVAQTGRLEESKRLGFAYLKEGKFDRAAARLEEVHDIEKTDAAVNEALAIAYLNGDDRKDNPGLDNKAFEILSNSLASGGKAPFLVYLSLGSSLFSPTNVCGGRLTLQTGRLTFVCERGDKPTENSFDLTNSDITEIGERFGRGKGMFFVRTAKRTYNFIPANWEQRHSERFLELALKYLEIRKKK